MNIMSSSCVVNSINNYTHSITIKGEFIEPLYESITKIIPHSYLDSETNSIIFNAERIKSLKPFLFKQTNKKLSHFQIIQLIHDLSKQINILHMLGFAFYGFDIDNILTIDDKFVFVSDKYLRPIVDDCIIFYSPMIKPYFSSPEIINLHSLPSKISYKTSYYSLAVLVVFCIFNKYLLVANEIKDEEEINLIVKPIHDTKLYYFIKRCLHHDIDKRILLLI